MGWDDYHNDDVHSLDWDYIDYMNKTGIYEESFVETDEEDELIMSGLNPDELEEMGEYERREALESAGLDPDDYDTFYSVSSSGSRPRSSSVLNKTTPYSSNTATSRSSNKGKKIGILEFTIVITIIAVIGTVVAAFAGELLGAIVVIIIGIVIMKNT